MPNHSTLNDLSDQTLGYLQDLLAVKQQLLEVTKVDLDNPHISRETKSLLTTAIDNEQYEINRLINHIDDYKTAMNNNKW